MISRETVANARIWYATGVNWIDKDAVNLGLTYLERAIPVFQEAGDTAAVARARHQCLLGLQKSQRHDEVETGHEDVLQAYVRAQDAYGQALLLTHVAESLARLGRWERAMVNLNLAEALAQAHGVRAVLRYAWERKAALFLERDSPVLAAQLLKRAEASCAEDGLEADVARLRAAQGSALARLGERHEAAGLLEDAQSRFVRLGRFRGALEALVVLARIYESLGQTDEENRTRELMHFCGQRVLKKDDERRGSRAAGEPPVDRNLVPAESA